MSRMNPKDWKTNSCLVGLVDIHWTSHGSLFQDLLAMFCGCRLGRYPTGQSRSWFENNPCFNAPKTSQLSSLLGSTWTIVFPGSFTKVHSSLPYGCQPHIFCARIWKSSAYKWIVPPTRNQPICSVLKSYYHSQFLHIVSPHFPSFTPKNSSDSSPLPPRGAP